MEVTLEAFRKRYQYESPKDLIGRGGFSDVYKAWDTQDEQFVALKIATASVGEKYSLVNEIKKIKKLKHPNLINYYEVYEVSTGTKDIHGNTLNYQVAVMEYADGGTLADVLKNGTLKYAEAEEMAQGIINGLAYLHANTITHRDLKPANILITYKDGKPIPKITDFGIAKNSTLGNTASTLLVGTVEYMAPEFFKQGENQNVSSAADVWSLGVILLEALTGIHPFGKTSQGKNNEQIIYNILSSDINPVLQTLHAPFKELITRCLIREPNLRPQNAAELKGLLLQSGDVFGERTHVIDDKFRKTISKTQKSKLEKWKTALFDFNFLNGNKSKVIARELLLLILLPLLINPLLWAILLLPFCYMIDLDGARSTPFIEFYPKALFVILFDKDKIVMPLLVTAILLFPLRYLTALFLWIVHTLGFTFPVLPNKLKKIIGISIVALVLSNIAWIAYSDHNKIVTRTQEEIARKTEDSIAKADAAITEEIQRKKAEGLKKIYCTEEQALQNFKAYMKFNYPDWKIIGNPTIQEHSDCSYRIQFTTLNPIYHGDYMFKEVMIVEISYDSDYTHYYCNTIRGNFY